MPVATGNPSSGALRAGAKEFLTAPVVLEELLLALTRLRQNRVSADGTPAVNGNLKTESLVITIVGTRGGVGCTSVAVNLGCNLAQDPTHPVALIDLDLALGDADVALDIIPDYTLAGRRREYRPPGHDVFAPLLVQTR